MPGREGKRVEETEPEVEREHSWALQRLITHFSRPVAAHARTAPPRPHPHSRYNVELQGCEAAHPENMEGDRQSQDLLLLLLWFLVWKIESLGLVGPQEVSQTLWQSSHGSA